MAVSGIFLARIGYRLQRINCDPGLPNACYHLAAVSWGAKNNHLEVAQVNGIVSLPLISATGRHELRPPPP
jgi:hypothetical protein